MSRLTRAQMGMDKGQGALILQDSTEQAGKCKGTPSRETSPHSIGRWPIAGTTSVQHHGYCNGYYRLQCI